jgi:starch-binding outer membrane protein, SusD/RagB family
MKRIYEYVSAAALGLVMCLATGCLKDLDQYPHTDTTSKDVYTSVENYESVLSGIYTSMIVNLSSIADDDRYQNYTRCLTMFQECSADTMDDVWLSGETMTDVSFQQWNAGDPWVSAMFYHIYNIISLSNEFIRNSSEDAISGFSEADKEKIRGWRDEARGLRALAYYHELDFFNVASFVTEDNEVGSYIPETYSRKQLFEYIESELKELGGSLPSRNYGHFTRSAANALLARLYLNAEVYTGTARWNDCIAACNKVIEDGYNTLAPSYSSLFNADNDKRTDEIIFALACDATHTVAWGAGTYLVCASRFDNYDGILEDFGVATYWNCLRVRPQLVDLFTDGDSRAMFCSRDRKLYDEAPEDFYENPGDTKYKYRDREKEISKHDDVTTGWEMTKWTNLTDEGEVASDTRVNGAETDYPMFRLADVYLMAAEATLRGGTGAQKTALEYVNLVRERAFGGASGDIASADLTLDFILDERARELYSEGVRRTDLIRFGKYTSGYNWNWKGGVLEGKDVDKKYCVLPIPEAELSANPGFKAYNTELGY